MPNPQPNKLHLITSFTMSEQTELLLKAISKRTADPLSALFNPPTIVVPNSNVADYLQKMIACSGLECAFALKMPTLIQFLAEYETAISVPDDQATLRLALISLFLTPGTRAKLPPIVTNYLDSAPPNTKHPEVRAFHFADRLAANFAT